MDRTDDLPVCVNYRREHADVFIGRPSKWGNPFVIGRDGTRTQCIDKYRAWLPTQSQLMTALPELAGRRLGCTCKPKPCHGDVLVEFVRQYLADSCRAESGRLHSGHRTE
jgi:hypothetical protein